MKKTMWMLLGAIAILAALAAFGLAPGEALYSLAAVPVIGFAALTGDRDTPLREGELYSYGVAANAKGFAGGLIALNSAGYAVPASDTAGLRVVGRSEEAFDNTGGANGALAVTARRGVFKFAGTGLTVADIGKNALVTDDQTVSVLDTTNNVVAGVIVAVDSATEAWVEIGPSAGSKTVKGRLSYKSVAVTVAAAATAGSSAADEDLEGGEIVGYYPTGNQDQLADSVALGADGAVTVTLAAAATANNTFKVVVVRANG